MQIMKKLLFIFSMALICAITTSSFKPVQSAAAEFNQTITEAPTDVVKSSDKKKEDKKKQKKAAVSSCCQAKTQKVECPEAQQKSCAASEVKCQEEKKVEKK
jgi:hypothetical protein